MFVQQGAGVGGGQLASRWAMRIMRDADGAPIKLPSGASREESVPPSKVRADLLLSEDVNKRLKLLCFASGGARIPVPASEESRPWRMPFIARLGLQDCKKVRKAFLEIYGQRRRERLRYMRGCFGTQCSHVMGAVCCGQATGWVTAR
jgi:hypothetical protein